MLPDKVIKGARALLRRRVARICRLLNLENDKAPTNVLAMEAKLIGDVAWLLAPESMADALGTEKALKARRMFRVCAWDGECNEDATTDDGLCPAHAEQQAREEAETDAEVDAMLAEAVAECRASDS